MERDRILGILREHAPELRAAGLVHLRLFGSVARGDNTVASDVDILFDHDEASGRDILHAFGFEDRISEIIGAKAHLTAEIYLKPRIRERILREVVSVF